MLRIDPSDAVPIWKQIEEGVRLLVASGSLAAGDPVASVREMARTLRVNPLTVQKAYRRLAETGLLIVRRGEGTFVAPDPPRLDAVARAERLADAAMRFASLSKTLGAEEDEMLDAVRHAQASLGAIPTEDDADE